MHVAILSWDFPPKPTGLGRAASEIAHGLAEQGAEVTVFSADRAGEEAAAFGRVVGCAPARRGATAFVRKRAAIGHLVAPAAFASAVRRIHRQTPFDVIEATNWYGPAALLTGKTPPLFIRHSTPAANGFGANPSLRDRIDNRYVQWLESRTSHRATALISNTVPHRQMICDLYDLPQDDPNHHVIGLSLADDFIGEGSQTQSRLAPNDLLFIGRAERRKGFDGLLAALPLVELGRERRGQPPPTLHLVGLDQGEWERVRQSLPEEKANRIVWHGRADDRTIRDLLRSVAAVVAPSRYESYGIVYREAAAFGRPLIACAEDPSARAFLDEVRCGVLAERCDGPAIAKAIETALDSSRLAGFRRAGLSHAATLTRRALGAATLAVYRSVLDDSARASRPVAA